MPTVSYSSVVNQAKYLGGDLRVYACDALRDIVNRMLYSLYEVKPDGLRVRDELPFDGQNEPINWDNLACEWVSCEKGDDGTWRHTVWIEETGRGCDCLCNWVASHIPRGAEDTIEIGLTHISAFVGFLGLGEEARGLLGGLHGYGAEYENDVFMMHPYCWCEQDDCPWCVGCSCPESSWHYYVDGKEVTREKFVNFFVESMGDPPLRSDSKAVADWEERRKAVEARREVRKDPVCRFCTEGIGIDKGAEPGKAAPNFWYNPSNYKVWWYKWIGRSMEYNREIDLAEWLMIYSHCLDSLIWDRHELPHKGRNRRR